MKALKHVLFVHIFPWFAHAATDFKAWFIFILGTLSTTGAQFLAGLDFNTIQTWTLRQWCLRALVTFAPPLITALNAGRPHETAAQIAAKLAALPPAPPPAPPAP